MKYAWEKVIGYNIAEWKNIAVRYPHKMFFFIIDDA